MTLQYLQPIGPWPTFAALAAVWLLRWVIVVWAPREHTRRRGWTT